MCITDVMRLAKLVEKIHKGVLILGDKFGPVQRPTVIPKAELQWKLLDIYLRQHIRIQCIPVFEKPGENSGSKYLVLKYSLTEK